MIVCGVNNTWGMPIQGNFIGEKYYYKDGSYDHTIVLRDIPDDNKVYPYITIIRSFDKNGQFIEERRK